MYVCSNCGAASAKWQGKCFSCGEWNTLVTAPEPKKAGGKSKSGEAAEATALGSVKSLETDAGRLPSASAELSRVLGGGLVPGSLTLLSGEPGIGKSTLALQVAGWNSVADSQVLYVTAEETLSQLANRAKRLRVPTDGLSAVALSDADAIIDTLRSEWAKLAIVDSVSMLSTDEATGSPGSVGQIRTVTEKLMQYAKTSDTAIVLIGHVTKDGSISGPKALEHLVDTVLFLEGTRYESYRILRALKNRFGPSDEVGLFRMTATGLQDMADPGKEFVSENRDALVGSALGITLEGSRALLFEIEALATVTKFGYPKRSARGIPQGKLDLLIAVANRYADAKLDGHDVYVNVSKGFSLDEPGADLAILAAILSSRWNIPLGSTVFMGEAGLTGLVRAPYGAEERLKLAGKLGLGPIVMKRGKGEEGSCETVRELASLIKSLLGNKI